VVVNSDEFVVEVIHPLTNEIVHAKKPKVDLKPGDEVFVIEYNESFYAIPKELIL
jgi:NMD protein affecting ribosome stability and mRNA decay